MNPIRDSPVLAKLARFYDPGVLTYPNWEKDLFEIQGNFMSGTASSLGNDLDKLLCGIEYREKLHRKDTTDSRVNKLLRYQENPQNCYFSYANYRDDLQKALRYLRDGASASFDGILEHMEMREKMSAKMRPIVNPYRKRAFLWGMFSDKSPISRFGHAHPHPLADQNLIRVIFDYL